MGFRQSNCDTKKLSDILGIDEEELKIALKKSAAGGFARIWSVEDKGNYSIAKISTSKKRKEDGGYTTDFQDGFVRFIGSAHEKIKSMNVTDKGVTIQITSCEVTTPYDEKTKKGYTNYAVFAFNDPDDNSSDSGKKKSTAKTSKTKAKAKADPVPDEESEDDLPF